MHCRSRLHERANTQSVVGEEDNDGVCIEATFEDGLQCTVQRCIQETGTVEGIVRQCTLVVKDEETLVAAFSESCQLIENVLVVNLEKTSS